MFSEFFKYIYRGFNLRKKAPPFDDIRKFGWTLFWVGFFLLGVASFLIMILLSMAAFFGSDTIQLDTFRSTVSTLNRVFVILGLLLIVFLFFVYLILHTIQKANNGDPIYTIYHQNKTVSSLVLMVIGLISIVFSLLFVSEWLNVKLVMVVGMSVILSPVVAVLIAGSGVIIVGIMGVFNQILPSKQSSIQKPDLRGLGKNKLKIENDRVIIETNHTTHVVGKDNIENVESRLAIFGLGKKETVITFSVMLLLAAVGGYGVGSMNIITISASVVGLVVVFSFFIYTSGDDVFLVEIHTKSGDIISIEITDDREIIEEKQIEMITDIENELNDK